MSYKVTWSYGVRTYDHLDQLTCCEEFRFFFPEVVYMTVYQKKVEVFTRNRKWGMIIECESHRKAIECAEFCAGLCEHLYEISIVVDRERYTPVPEADDDDLK